MNETRYSPPYKPFVGASIAFLMLVISSVLSYFSLRIHHTFFRFVLCACAMLLILLCFQTFFRYCLTRYVYQLDGQILRVVRQTGKYESVIFDLTLLSAVAIEEPMSKRRIKQKHSLDKSVRWEKVTQDIFCKKYCLIYESPHLSCALLQINSDMAEEINERIQNNPLFK